MALHLISDAVCFISHYFCEVDGICRSFNLCHYLVLGTHVGAVVALCLVVYAMYVTARMMYAWVDEPVDEKELNAYLADKSGEKPVPVKRPRHRAERIQDYDPNETAPAVYKTKLRRRNVPKVQQKARNGYTPQMHGDVANLN